MGDPGMSFWRFRHEISKPTVVDADANGLEVVVPRVAQVMRPVVENGIDCPLRPP